MAILWILGDQLLHDHPLLSHSHSSSDEILLIESRSRSKKMRYHKRKLVFIHSAMRHFAHHLTSSGWCVSFIQTDLPLLDALSTHCHQRGNPTLRIMEPNDWASSRDLAAWKSKYPGKVDIIPNDMFLVSREDFRAFACMKSSLLMEQHYRKVRLKYGLLVDDKGKPEGGTWNFDSSNRKTFANWKTQGRPSPEMSGGFPPDAITLQAMEDVQRYYNEHPGDITPFDLPVTREDALVWLNDFIRQRLENFGPYEDIMVSDAPVLFHSMLSPLLNVGLLRPMECISKAIDAYRQGTAPLESVEGFVRQIAGWREFVNGIYWLRMPEYESCNELGAKRPLPSFFYTGETELNCLRQVLHQLLRTGYNHHIQRLMVLGNFMLLTGVRPQDAYRWFLEMYIDAYDWVMAANVIGMTLYADGGFMATKPYAAGAGYISKMSDYCNGCQYNPKLKTGKNACPFNTLYWHFLDRHNARFQNNPRMSMILNSWNKRSEADRNAVLTHAEDFLATLDP